MGGTCCSKTAHIEEHEISPIKEFAVLREEETTQEKEEEAQSIMEFQNIVVIVKKLQAWYRRIRTRRLIKKKFTLTPQIVIKACNSQLASFNKEVKNLEEKKGDFEILWDQLKMSKNRIWKKQETDEEQNTYYGYWSRLTEKKDGFGVQLFADGSKYSGMWRSGVIQGEGRMIFENGDYYCGEWENGMANGKGICVSSDGTRYEGDWKDNLHHGKGKEFFSDKTVYEGSFFMGSYQGHGTLSLPDGSIYDGDFQDNEMEGFGTYKWGNGCIYEGYWVKNRMEGKGRFVVPNTYVYVGYFLNDQKNGFGLITWDSGARYEGFWKNGEFNGKGTFIDENKKCQIGIWETGRPKSIIKTYSLRSSKTNVTSFDKQSFHNYEDILGQQQIIQKYY